MKSLKSKHSEGFHRIPKKILCDGVDILAKLKHKLMTFVYSEKRKPEQLLVSKTTLVLKKQKPDKRYKSKTLTPKVFEKL